jgi:hypothetical protein
MPNSGYGNITLASASNGAEIVTRIKSELTTAWGAPSGSTWTSAVPGGPTLVVTISATSLGANGSLSIVLGSNEGTTSRYIMSGNSTLTSSFVGLEYSISSSHFYIRLTGPTNSVTGTFNATYGSPSTFILLTTYTPYFTVDNGGSAESRKWAIVSSLGSGIPSSATITTPPTAQQTITLPYSDVSPGSSTDSAELLTIRPAIQDTAAVGDLIPNKAYAAGDVYWPFIIDSVNRGLIGRLDNIYFGSDNYFLAGDTATLRHTKESVVIGGVRYVRTIPAYFPNSAGSIWYTPLGLCNPTVTTIQGVAGAANTTGLAATAAAGGPIVLIKRGNGLA